MSPQFPTTAMMYMKQNGKEIQMCAASSPGILEDEVFRCQTGAVDSMHDGQ